jgi:DNA-binding transcriptional MocR family regulator
MENEHGQQESVQWRREKVLELNSKGHSQREISTILQVSVGTVNRDLTCLREQSRQKIKNYTDEVLPNEYEKCLIGITSILKEAWNISNNTEADSKREKIQALSLAKECYSMKLDLLTNATVVNDAMRFVSSNNNKKSVSGEEDSSSQECKEEPDYDDKDQLEEESQQEEVGGITAAATNQVF